MASTSESEALTEQLAASEARVRELERELTEARRRRPPGRPSESSLPGRVVVGANGAYWRDFGDSYSMCLVSDDNDPVEPIAVYVRAESTGPCCAGCGTKLWITPDESGCGNPRCLIYKPMPRRSDGLPWDAERPLPPLGSEP